MVETRTSHMGVKVLEMNQMEDSNIFLFYYNYIVFFYLLVQYLLHKVLSYMDLMMHLFDCCNFFFFLKPKFNNNVRIQCSPPIVFFPSFPNNVLKNPN